MDSVGEESESYNLYTEELNRWNQAKDWAELIQLNRSFIFRSSLGNEDVLTPYHLGPLDSETMPLVDPLLRLHEYGMLSSNSQPGKIEKPHFFEGRWIQARQKFYVEFLIPGDLGPDVSTFLAKLTTLSNTFVKVVRCGSGKREIMFNTYGEEGTYPLTAYRTSRSKQGLLLSQWSPYTALSMDTDDGMIGGFEDVVSYKNAQLCKETYLYEVTVMSKTWGEPMHMLDQVERLASRAGLRRRPEYSDLSDIPGSGTA